MKTILSWLAVIVIVPLHIIGHAIAYQMMKSRNSTIYNIGALLQLKLQSLK